jgi:hypothetical protein
MLARNMERYAERIAALEAAGSDVLVVCAGQRMNQEG